MIEVTNSGDLANMQDSGVSKKKILYWKKNERMGGMVPVWGVENTAKGNVAEKLSKAATGTPKEDNFETAMAYAENSESPAVDQGSEEFGFGDLLDMINPLHHLPLVGYVYREVTGDEIKPVAKIIGDGIFGGVAGAAASLVDTVVEYETGKSLTGNMVALVADGQTPRYRSAVADHPEKRLNEAVKNIDKNPHDLPGSVISFTDLGHNKNENYKRVPAADGRTAGTVYRKAIETLPQAMIREPITMFDLTPLSALRREYN